MAAFTLNPVIVVITYQYKMSDTDFNDNLIMPTRTICTQNPNSSKNHTLERISFHSPDKKTSGAKIAIDMMVLY